jgi:hypothetical protein
MRIPRRAGRRLVSRSRRDFTVCSELGELCDQLIKEPRCQQPIIDASLTLVDAGQNPRNSGGDRALVMSMLPS